MRLIEWLEINEMTTKSFANQIGKAPSLVHKYMYENVVPNKKSMNAIYKATYGLVSADDFYNLTLDADYRYTDMEL